ncbi:MAG: Lrp/AsnC family transcriptional regulator [Bacteroidota bacterium]
MDTPPLQLDRTDREILKRLQARAKLTNVQLAEEIGLSPASTLERVRKLESKGVIKSYHARLAPEKLALHAQLIVQVKLEQITAHSVKAFQQAIAAIPEIAECHQVIGDADFVLKIVTKDMAAYQQLIMHQLSAVENIQFLKPLVITNTSKESGIPVS